MIVLQLFTVLCLTFQERNALDNRVHCVFYFVAPHRIKDIDKEFIKTLNGLAPMVLVVAKADTMTLQERRKHLQNVFAMMRELNEICEHPIVFDFEEGGDGVFMEDDAPQGAYVDPVDCSSCMVVDEPPAEVEHTQLEQEDQEEDTTPSQPSPVSEASYDLPATTEGKPSAVEVSPHAEIVTEHTPTAFQALMYLQGEHAQLHVPLPRIRNVFAVVCDTSESGKREYPWGSLNIYDEEHSDFRRLQRVVLEGEKITGLIEQTQMMSLRIYKNTTAAGKVGGVAALTADTLTTTVTAPAQPATPLQKAMAVLYRVKAALDTCIITLFYAMLPLLLWVLVIGKK